MDFKLFKDAFKHFGDKNPNMLGGSIAFYVIYSLGPLVTLLVWILAKVFEGQQATQKVVDQVTQTMGEQTGSMVQSLFQGSQSGAGVSSVLSIGMLLTGGIMIFYQMRNALNIIWEVEEANQHPSIGDRIRDYIVSLFMLIFTGAILIALVAKTLFVYGAAEEVFPFPNIILQVVDILLNFLILTIFFIAIYKYLPQKDIHWKDVRGGAFLTSVLLVIAQFLIGLYLSNKSMTGYGAFGSMIVIVIWVYYSSMAFVYGACLTYIYARREGSLKDAVPTGIKPDRMKNRL